MPRRDLADAVERRQHARRRLGVDDVTASNRAARSTSSSLCGSMGRDASACSVVTLRPQARAIAASGRRRHRP